MANAVIFLVFFSCFFTCMLSVPMPCCLVSQWEVYMGTTETTLSQQYQNIKRGTKYISMDFQNKMMAVESRYNDEESKYHKTIYHFNEHKEYTIEGNNCTVQIINFGMQPQCIPSDAIYLGSSYIGSGNAQIPFDSWSYFLTGFMANISVSVSQDGCVPLAEVVESSSSGSKFTMMAVFTTFTPGIKDPNVFVPPSSCEQTLRSSNVI